MRHIVAREVPIAPLTTWGVGGSAETMLVPRDAGEARNALKWLADTRSSYFVLGGGSNVLVADEGTTLPLIHTIGMDRFRVRVDAETVYIDCGAGLPLRRALALSLREGWSGLEFAAGIPGTVGGALLGNAGSRYGEIGEVVERLQGVDSAGDFFEIDGKDVSWGYRSSSVEGRGWFVCAVTLRLRASTPSAVRERIAEVLEGRKSQPTGRRTAGCVFKNPEGDSAGRLLDAAGCKGLAIGGASVSRTHANFIESEPGCMARDILRLISLCRTRVREVFGITLLREVKAIGIPEDLWNEGFA